MGAVEFIALGAGEIRRHEPKDLMGRIKEMIDLWEGFGRERKAAFLMNEPEYAALAEAAKATMVYTAAGPRYAFGYPVKTMGTDGELKGADMILVADATEREARKKGISAAQGLMVSRGAGGIVQMMIVDRGTGSRVWQL